MRCLLHLVAALLVLLSAPAASQNALPPSGFLWKQSPLPATLPLDVESTTGLHHVILLAPPGSDRPVMAGFLRAGEVLRLRVPPGDWQIGLASGSEWQGQKTMFGTGTDWTVWPETLFFTASNAALQGYAVKIGMIDGAPRITAVDPRIICQLPTRRPAPSVRPLEAQPMTRYDPMLKRSDTSWSNPLLRRDNMDRLNFARPEQRPDDRLALQRAKRGTLGTDPPRRIQSQPRSAPCPPVR